MTTDDSSLGHLYLPPRRLDVGIGVVGSGFIVRDCHLVAYSQAGFRVVGLTSRNLATAHEVARLCRVFPAVHQYVRKLVRDDDAEIARPARYPDRVAQLGPRAAVAAADGFGLERRALARAGDEVDRGAGQRERARELARDRRVEVGVAHRGGDAHQLRLGDRDLALVRPPHKAVAGEGGP